MTKKMKGVVVAVVTAALCLGSLLAQTADKGAFWHVTDFHYDHTYWTEQLSCNNNVSSPGEYGDYWCDSPWRLVTHAINSMANIQPDVDFLLWTGDTVAHITDDHMSVDINMDVLQNLTTALTDGFPNKSVYATFGNHDYYPTNQFPTTNNIIYNRTANMWQHWIQEDEQLDNFRKGGYYTLLVRKGLRVVALNTNLYYTSDKLTNGTTDPTGQIAWFYAVMNKARADKEKVIVTAHIPPGIHTPRTVEWFQIEFQAPVQSALQNYTDIIVGLHFGHDHADGFKVLYDKQGHAGSPLFVAPSVTPWRFKLKTGEIGPPHDPSVRLVTYDRATGRHLDIEQYRLNLPETKGQQPAVNFTLLYKFTQRYTVPDLTAASLDRLFTRMDTATEGDRLLQDYYRFTQAGAEQEASDSTCNKDCKQRILCGFRHYIKTQFDACLTNYINLATPAACPGTLATLLIATLVFLYHRV